jgi:hypothetical protein
LSFNILNPFLGIKLRFCLIDLQQKIAKA